jgi:hypothetical protein
MHGLFIFVSKNKNFKNSILLVAKRMSHFHKLFTYLETQPRYVGWLFKAIIACGIGIFIWFDIFQRENFSEISALFFQELKNGENALWLVACLMAMPVNWAAETFKWHHLVQKIQPLRWRKAYAAVFAGVTSSLFFPNRMGDFGGRILFLKPENAVKGVLSTFVSSWAQQLVLIGCGFLGFAYFLVVLWQTERLWVDLVLIGGLALVALLFFVFLHLEWVVPFFRHIRILYRFPRLIKSIHLLRQYTRSELLETLFWAFVRYLIYGVQYYFILRFFGIDVPILRGASCIATIYLLQTSIPLPPVVGLMARGEVALQVWGIFEANALSILAATLSLWVINVIAPALIGLIFILRINVLKQFGFEKKTAKSQDIISEISFEKEPI